MIRLQKKEKNVNLKVKRSKKNQMLGLHLVLRMAQVEMLTIKVKYWLETVKKSLYQIDESNTSKKRNKITKD